LIDLAGQNLFGLCLRRFATALQLPAASLL
jgi:hypothetical protein